MRGAIHDVASNGLAKTVSVQHATTTATAGILNAAASTGGNDVMSAFLSLDLTDNGLALTFAVTAFWFAVRPQIYCVREWYRNCFGCRAWYSPWRLWVWDLVWAFVDLLSVISIVHFLKGFPDPEAGTRLETLIFVTVLFTMLYVAFRWLWISAFWNWHNTKANPEGAPVFSSKASYALGFAILFAILMLLLSLGLVIVFGIARQWLSFFFIIPLFIWSIILLVWTALIYACIGTCPTPCEAAIYTLGAKKGNKK